MYIELPGRSYSVWARVSPVEPVNISASGATTFCHGDSIVLSFTGIKPCYTYQWRRNDVDIPGATNSELMVKESGNYVVYSGYSLVPIASSNTISVTVNPEHPLISVNGNTLSCSVNGVSYQWYEGITATNLSPIPGATSQSYDPPHGNYFAVEITDVNDCSDISSGVVVLPCRNSGNGFEECC
jgi:hypothetical protein